jgi:hypothetical protein
MHQPVIGYNWPKRLCKKIISNCDTWFAKHILAPTFILFPPILLTTIATKNGMQKQVVAIFGAEIGSFFNNSALLIIVLSYFYTVALKAIYAGIKAYAKPAKELTVGDLIAIIKAIDIVVSDKTKRMSGTAKKYLRAANLKASDTFHSITKPELQIPLLISGIRSVFEYMNSDTEYRVGLLRIIKSKPAEWFAFDPIGTPPRTEAKMLGSPSSTVSHCIKTKAIVVVEDIQKELKVKNKSDRRFLKSNTTDTDQGSQLCFPIIHASTGEIEYVITLAGNKSHCLKEDFIPLYTWILKHFAVRISMEHSLLILKERSSESEKSAA